MLEFLNPKKSLANKVFHYYNKMKYYEALFRQHKAMLTEQYPMGTTFQLPNGSITVSENKKVVLDIGKVLKTIPHNVLLEVVNIKVNVLVKYVGQAKFRELISHWNKEKSIIIKVKEK